MWKSVLDAHGNSMENIDGIEIIKEKNDLTIFKLYGSNIYYMSSKEKYFLIIDSKYFDEQWKKSSFKIQTALANIVNKKDDYKYKEAEKSFSLGIRNPVPVIEIYVEKDKDDIIPTLCDGLTRTNYLLSKNVKKLVFSLDENIQLETSKYYLIINIDNHFN